MKNPNVLIGTLGCGICIKSLQIQRSSQGADSSKWPQSSTEGHCGVEQCARMIGEVCNSNNAKKRVIFVT